MRLHYIALLAVVAACGEAEVTSSEPLGDEAPTAEAAPPHDAAPPHQGTASDVAGGKMKVLQGVVKKVVADDAHTFVRIDTCGEESWVRGPSTEVSEGQTVAILARPDDVTDLALPGTDQTLASAVDAVRMGASVVPVDCSEEATDGVGEVAPPGGMKEGTVLERFESGGYVYARVDFCGTEGWIAGPPTELDVGDGIALPGGTTMTDFHSKTLDRTFDRIDFVGVIQMLDGAPDC